MNNPIEAIEELAKQAPTHPYTKLGSNKFSQLAKEAENFLKEVGISVKGDARKNHFRMTPMGTLKPTWLTLEDHMQGENADRISWKKISIFNVTGFLDFYTQFIVDELAKIGTTCTTYESARQIKAENGDCEIIALPAIVGLSRKDAVTYLQKEIGKPICLLPTLPPSVPGIQVQQQLRARFQEQWYDRNAFAAQPYQTFGVRTDKDFRGLYKGEAIENLYISGAILEGFNAIKEGCGAGVSILSALYVADRISSK